MIFFYISKCKTFWTYLRYNKRKEIRWYIQSLLYFGTSFGYIQNLLINVESTYPFYNKNKIPRMFFEKSCIEFNCYISDNKEIWEFWYQCSIDGNVYWRFSFYWEKHIWVCGKSASIFPPNPLWLYHVYLYKWVVESQ